MAKLSIANRVIRCTRFLKAMKDRVLLHQFNMSAASEPSVHRAARSTAMYDGFRVAVFCSNLAETALCRRRAILTIAVPCCGQTALARGSGDDKHSALVLAAAFSGSLFYGGVQSRNSI